MKFKIIIPLFSLIMLFIFAGCDDDIVIPQYGNDQQVSSDSSYNSNVTSFVELIGADKAKEIALNHAGVSADRIYDLEIELDRDYGAISYEVSFKSDGYEYDYDLVAYSGSIIKSRKENDY